MALRWYVVHAYSNFEHRVAEALKERIKLQGLEHKFGEILVPTEEVVEMRDGQKRKSDRKFFPGYVLVQMEMDEDTWHLVKEVPKVLGFIGGTPEKPAPITDKEAMSILRRVEEGVDKPKPKVLFEPGEVVRVIDGPFNDFNGVVESVNYEKNRLQVAVQILGRSTPVELDFSQVEKAYRLLLRSESEALHRKDDWGARKSATTRGVTHGQESHWLYQAADSCRPGESEPAGRSGARSARREHHGVLQSVQRADAEPREGIADACRHHGLQRPQLHLRPQDAAGLGADSQGDRHREGQRCAEHEQGRPHHAQAARGNREDEAARSDRCRSGRRRAHDRRQRAQHGRGCGGRLRWQQ